jgi:hypothetical protein
MTHGQKNIKLIIFFFEIRHHGAAYCSASHIHVMRSAAVIITCYTETLQPQKPNPHVTHKPRNIVTKVVLPFGDNALTSSDSHLVSMATKNQASVVMDEPQFVVTKETGVLLHIHKNLYRNYGKY